MSDPKEDNEQNNAQPKLSYSSFSLHSVHKVFGIELRLQKLFADVEPIAPSEVLRASLGRATTVTLISEKARIDPQRIFVEHVDRILGAFVKMVS